MGTNNTSSNQSVKTSKLDGLKWFLILLLVAAGIGANYYYHQVAWALRAAGGIFLAAIVVAIALQTAKGLAAWNFFKGSRTELRKVVWPTRQETLQTTLVVVVMVIVIALILWGLDTFFFWAVSWLTGQRG